MSVKPIPDGYHSVTPYLTVKDAAGAIAFYTKAFGATELMRFPGPGGKIMHAEIRIGNSPIMLSDECPEFGHLAPHGDKPPVGFCIYLEDADAQFATAVAAGATVVKPLQDQFYGDRSGTVMDPYGHVWTLATHKEDVPSEEMQRRMEAMMKQETAA